MEHYCTLFDQSFLPQGMALRASLDRYAGRYRLWILCMDTAVEEALERLHLPSVRLLPVRTLEAMFPALAAVKANRTPGEYCWTATPFLPEAVLRLEPGAGRATYLDADTYFYGDPRQILSEFEDSGAHAMVTDHCYPPGDDKSAEAGRFNVQFMPFRNTPRARDILHWWQDRCLEWCHARYEDGKFGDQKYLDQWPGLFGDDVHVLRDGALTLAPWNVVHLWSADAPRCLYHHHGLRFFAGGSVVLFRNFRIPWSIERRVYGRYLRELRAGARSREAVGIRLEFPERSSGWRARLHRTKRWWTRRESWGSIAEGATGWFRAHPGTTNLVDSLAVMALVQDALPI